MKGPRFVTFLLPGFVVLGVGLLVASAFAYRSTRTFLAGAAAAEGTIVAYAEARDQEGHLSYYPVVSFRAQDGQRVEFQARTGGSSRGPLGERVAVLYDPRNPHEAAINSFFSLWFAPCCCSRWGWALPASASPCWSPSVDKPGAGAVPRRSGCGPRAAS
jgi:Protein of unknown function (DUF3592)